MKKIFPITLSPLLMFMAGSCASTVKEVADIDMDNVLAVSVAQLKLADSLITEPGMFPRSLFTDYSFEQLEAQLEYPAADIPVELLEHPSQAEFRKVRYCPSYDWTSGFYPGSLWYAYELTGDSTMKNLAIKYTNMLEPVQRQTDTHDLGFMVNCSYGNALRLTPTDSIGPLMVRTADNLVGRFYPEIGAIRSWDFGEWNCPVIIDNMMNLGLLFNATKLTGDSSYYDVAVKHAEKTLANHFRPDYTCYHVVSYNNDGSRESAGTFQGKNDGSAWSRGQGWALYGFTETYRETGRKDFLAQAVAVADMVISRNKTADKVPYWDFDAPEGENTPRDASAAAVIASGMLELGYHLGDKGNRYTDYARNIIASLASSDYLAQAGTNQGFILMHSVGSMPHGSEIDTPLNYADYYFLEALVRLKRINEGKNPVENII